MISANKKVTSCRGTTETDEEQRKIQFSAKRKGVYFAMIKINDN